MFVEAHSFEWYTVPSTGSSAPFHAYCVIYTIPSAPALSHRLPVPYLTPSNHGIRYYTIGTCTVPTLYLQISKNSCMSPNFFRAPLLHTAIKMSKRVSTAQRPPTDHSSLEEEETNINLSIFLDILHLQRHSPRRQLPVSPKSATPKSFR